MHNNIGSEKTGQANKATIWFIVGFIVLCHGGGNHRRRVFERDGTVFKLKRGE